MYTGPVPAQECALIVEPVNRNDRGDKPKFVHLEEYGTILNEPSDVAKQAYRIAKENQLPCLRLPLHFGIFHIQRAFKLLSPKAHRLFCHIVLDYFRDIYANDFLIATQLIIPAYDGCLQREASLTNTYPKWIDKIINGQTLQDRRDLIHELSPKYPKLAKLDYEMKVKILLKWAEKIYIKLCRNAVIEVLTNNPGIKEVIGVVGTSSLSILDSYDNVILTERFSYTNMAFGEERTVQATLWGSSAGECTGLLLFSNHLNKLGFGAHLPYESGKYLLNEGHIYKPSAPSMIYQFQDLRDSELVKNDLNGDVRRAHRTFNSSK